ncbi:hypothetical protein MFIFM68171_09527 [Madurella fahalii]|uniref:Uncharacterized protein n=1 Tax=Madurella fahalii TaxID=1157608 RepID=A0ABQ0GNG9_9PEZI
MGSSDPQDISFQYCVSNEWFDRTEEDDLTVGEFIAWVTNRHQIPGLVSLSCSGKTLTDRYAILGDVLREEKTLHVNSDRTIAVAAGGVAMGGEAYTKHGVASATGGLGMGGRVDASGKVIGGRALGGRGQGEKGQGGEGWGGMASNPKGGEVKSGRGTGGEFEVANGQKGWSFPWK